MNRPLTEVYSLAVVNKYGYNEGWQVVVVVVGIDFCYYLIID